MDDWLEPVVEAFNEVLDEPLEADNMRERTTELHKRTRMLKRFMRLERFWSTKVRRRPFDSFITDSYTGELL